MTWRHQAACQYEDSELFFPVSKAATGQIRRAKDVCRSCPVEKQCAQYAIEHCITDGIWGGMTEHELRWQIRMHRKAKAGVR